MIAREPNEEAAQASDDLRPGPEGEMGGVGQNDLGADGGEVVGPERLDGRLGAHRHEGGGVRAPVRGLQAPQPGRAGLRK